MPGISGKRILLTGVGGAAAISFLRALRGQDVQIWAADIDPYAAGLYLVPEERRCIIPGGKSADFVDHLVGRCKEHEIDILVPTVDCELIPIARAKESFRSSGTRLLLSPLSSLKTCLDKWNLAQLRSESIPLPLSTLFVQSRLPDGWEFPLVLKPRQGSGSNGVHVIYSQEDLNRLDPDPSMLMQEFLPGSEYSVDVFVTSEGEVKAAVPRERLKIDSGIAVMSRTVKNPTLESLARIVARVLGIRFTANIQFKFNRYDEPVLMEVNPRFSGTMSLTVESGVNMPLLSIKSLLGEKIEEHEYKFSELAVARFLEEEFLPIHAVKKMEEMAENLQNPSELMLSE